MVVVWYNSSANHWNSIIHLCRKEKNEFINGAMEKKPAVKDAVLMLSAFHFHANVPMVITSTGEFHFDPFS